MRIRLIGVLTASALVLSNAALAQEVRVMPTAVQARRQWDARVRTDVRNGELRRRSVRPDRLMPGRMHERLDQFVRGVRVYGGDVTRQIDEIGQTVSVFGTLYDGITIPVTPTLSQADAKRRIEALGGATLGESRQPELVVLPLEGGRFALTWHQRIFAPATARVMSYFIDAHTGAIVEARNDTQTQSAVGRGTGVLGDTKKLSVAPEGGTHYAFDNLRPPVLETFDLKFNLNRLNALLNGQIPFLLSDLAKDTDNVWTDGATVDAHAYAGFTYDYLFKRLERSGLDNDDLPILSIVHPVNRADYATVPDDVFGGVLLNAGYYGNGIVVYGDGLPPGIRFLGQTFDYFSGALDIVAHELAHGVTEFSSGLIYQGEAGALNESFSDIIGASVEFFFQERGNGALRAEWLMGEDVIRPGGIRNMANPRSFGDPDHYSNRYTGLSDNGGVHINSAIPNLAFYLAVEGGPHPRTGAGVAGVGFSNREQIEKVFYRAFTQLMPSNATFHQARVITLQAARDLYGAGSAPERAVREAWSAVGVH